MRFHKNIIKSSVDIEGYDSIIFNSIEGCNFNCYKCFNRKELLEKKHNDYLTESDVLNILQEYNGFFDAVVFSGGEFLISDESEIIYFLEQVKYVFDGKIIIYTNGSYYNKIQAIIHLVDGFHVDIKFNYFNPSKYVYDIINIPFIEDVIQTEILRTLDLVYINNKGLSQFRTVKYDILSEEYLKELKEEVAKRYPNIQYRQNYFMKGDY